VLLEEFATVELLDSLEQQARRCFIAWTHHSPMRAGSLSPRGLQALS
jgi:hypothetical protein